MLKHSHWMTIGGVVFAGVVMAAVPLVQRAGAGAPAVAAEPATTSRPHPAASLTLAPHSPSSSVRGKLAFSS